MFDLYGQGPNNCQKQQNHKMVPQQRENAVGSYMPELSSTVASQTLGWWGALNEKAAVQILK